MREREVAIGQLYCCQDGASDRACGPRSRAGFMPQPVTGPKTATSVATCKAQWWCRAPCNAPRNPFVSALRNALCSALCKAMWCAQHVYVYVHYAPWRRSWPGRRRRARRRRGP
eukprot:scaffold88603_cov92-Phaeocystis_antarctica.AAC.3